MTTIYLVRHCEAYGNIARVFQGHIDSDISDNGAVQLQRLAERFRDIPLDAVYSSPLRRARKTAEAIDTYHHLPIVLDDDLMEINGGRWEGQLWAELPVLYPEESEHWAHRPWMFAPADGEPMAAVYARMARALTSIAAAHPAQTVAVASHGCAIRNALCWAKGWPIERLGEVAWCDNTAVTVLELDEKLTPRVICENDNSHLDSEVSTLEKQSWWRDDAVSRFD